MKKVKLRDGELTIKVRELTVRDVMQSMGKIQSLVGENLSVDQLASPEHMALLTEISEVILEFPDGVEFLDLKFSEIQELISPVMEVNASFFGQMSALGLIPDLSGGSDPAPIEENPTTPTSS